MSCNTAVTVSDGNAKVGGGHCSWVHYDRLTDTSTNEENAEHW